MKNSTRIAFLFMGMAVVYSQTSVMAQKDNRSTALPQSRISSLRAASDYFPLKVGNEWIYSNGSESYKMQVLQAPSLNL
jgi:hypothetical protein